MTIKFSNKEVIVTTRDIPLDWRGQKLDRCGFHQWENEYGHLFQVVIKVQTRWQNKGQRTFQEEEMDSLEVPKHEKA